ncbi:MAG: twin-arginine translocase TatA/TatE family subunit [Planctomycetes bacterium]|nr:twin-arginine translocase TatA/TatE family subunit [Planctomycetota bacterium]
MTELPTLALGFAMPGGFEWIVIALALLLLFGRRLPEVMRGLGGSVREFKKGIDEGHAKTDPPPTAPPVEGAVSRDRTDAPAGDAKSAHADKPKDT